ncbi:MAG TPA: hypothetical protein VK691_10065 [Solirubrobacteraceae bacterium]|jgi:hypothetical protein|nr:hypothetical protein [Solirubrobacteraceae bacterium]
MPRASEARAWWADVEDVRERIERRRDGERRAATVAGGRAAPATRRGVREIRPGQRLMLVERAAPPRDSHRRPRRPMVRRVGPRPDMIAAWAAALGFLLVAVAILSAH